MTASEIPEVKSPLPGVIDLLKTSAQFLITPPHASVLFGFAGWLLIPVLIGLGSSFLDPTYGDPLNFLAGIVLFGLSLWATAAITIIITGIARPDLTPKDVVTSVSELAWRRAPTLLWIGLLSGILQIFGFFLLIIPGIIFTVWFAFAETEAILTGVGTFSALEQSRERVRGHFFGVLWRLVAFSLILTVFIALILWPLFMATGMHDPMVILTAPPVWLDTLLSVIEILLMPVILTYEMHLYFSLRKP